MHLGDPSLVIVLDSDLALEVYLVQLVRLHLLLNCLLDELSNGLVVLEYPLDKHFLALPELREALKQRVGEVVGKKGQFG